MHRRPLGRGRTLAAIAGVLLVIGCVLPWWMVGGGETGITPESGNGFEGAGIVVFLVGILVLALVALPYAVGDRPLGVDRWITFLILTAAGWIGLGISVIQLMTAGAFSFSQPVQVFTNGPGLWLAVLGLIVLSRATYDMAREPARR
jgi:high-affinity Fe2+/Pb2+ permease